jgi:NADPH:quinone reductase-like Zn-dependent oxidoreductase
MKAVVINQHGSPDVLEYVHDYPIPDINENEVLVKIHSASINRVDTVIRRGYPGLTLPLSHIPGGDAAGTIVQTGKKARHFKIDERVVVYPIVLPEKRDPHYIGREHLNDGWQYFGMHRQGTYAEYLAVPAENLVKINDDISFEEAATLPIAGLTAYRTINTVGNVQAGDVFFIWGGAGGMGTILIQLAKNVGATVITTTSKNEKKDKLYELGADYVFNHLNDDVVTEVKKLFPAGVDHVLDYVGPATFQKSFALVRKGGKILLCGMLTGMETTLHIQQTYFRHISILGLYLGTPDEFKKLVDLVAEKKIKPQIHTVLPLHKAAEGHRIIESGNYTGKIVLNVE